MYSAKTPIYTAEQIREIERLAAERYALSGAVLMDRAAQAAFRFFQERWPAAHEVAVFCGSGNNGGDGYVLAALLQNAGVRVSMWQIGDHSHLQNEAKAAFDKCQTQGVRIETFTADAELGKPDVIIDAICGIGLHDRLRDDVVLAIEKIEILQVPVFAIDIPTGINADTGSVLGSALHARVTMTFIGLKLGLLTGMGVAYAGEVVCDNLDLPDELMSTVRPVANKIEWHTFAAYLKPRPRYWHKGLSGHVLVVGGEIGYSGAPRMAGEAALHVGAGLVTIATHPDNALTMNLHMPELMCRGVRGVADLEPLLAKADVVVIGPGLGQTKWSKELWQFVSQKERPKVVDADGLNLLAGSHLLQNDWVLTPHPGEAAKLLGQTTQSIQQDRLAAGFAISQRYGGVCVLKGAGSLIFAPDALPALCDKGNPGMASAGMGDVLSGVIGGLIAQGIPLDDAARLGVVVHGLAGDMAARDGERGMVATDLMPYLRKLVN